VGFEELGGLCWIREPPRTLPVIGVVRRDERDMQKQEEDMHRGITRDYYKLSRSPEEEKVKAPIQVGTSISLFPPAKAVVNE